MNELTLDKEEFRDWLTKWKASIVGDCRSATSCPIANFLSSKGVAFPAVSRRNRSGYILNQLNRKAAQNPPWAECFVKKVDMRDGGTISGNECLVKLKECEDELEAMERSTPHAG